MAISSKIEEVILEITKTAGNISDSLKIGIGETNIPGSSIFEINNLLSVANTGYPFFGIVETDTLGFQASYSASDDRYNVKISSGKVSYNGSLIDLLEQKVSIKKDFIKDYNLTAFGATAYKYGITIGFPLSEAEKSIQTYNTSVNATSLSGTNVLYVTSTSNAKTLGFPLEAHVGSIYLRFIGVNDLDTGLIIDSTFYNGSQYGVLPSTIIENTPVKFVYQPKLQYISGFPISTSSSDPSLFHYFPPLPSSWLPVAKVLVEDPNFPIIAGTGRTAFIRTVVDIPTNTSTNKILGDSADVSNVIQSCNSAIDNLRNYRKNAVITSVVNALNQYTYALTSVTNLKISQYWSLQPFRPTQYYSKGLSFSGLERFEFPSNFAEAYYNITGQDLQHTFAVFRGDLIDYNQAALGSTVIPCAANYSSLTSGTQIYGVSGVRSIALDEYLETVPSYSSKISTTITSNNYMVELNWSGSGVTDSLFYHIYKRPNLSSELTENRITNIDEIKNYPYFTGLAITDTTSYTVPRFSAISIIPNEDCFVGGVTLKFGFSAPGQTASIGSTGVNIALYGNSAGAPDSSTLLAYTDTLRYEDVSEGFGAYTVKFDTGINLDASTQYWLVIDKPTNLTVGTGSTEMITRVINSGTSKLLSSSSFGSWVDSGKTPYVKLRGYLDNGSSLGTNYKRGIKFTNKIANKPRRLSVYVPPVENIINNTGLILNGNTTGTAFSTDTSIKNELLVTVYARNGTGGTTTVMSTLVPKGTIRDTRFLLGADTDLFDRVDNIIVSPGTDLTRVNNGPIIWDIYDLITVETEP
jgi:hypothetical protein